MTDQRKYMPSLRIHRYSTAERVLLHNLLQREDPSIIMSKVPRWQAIAFGREAYGMTREEALSKLRQRIDTLAPTN